LELVCNWRVCIGAINARVGAIDKRFGRCLRMSGRCQASDSGKHKSGKKDEFRQKHRGFYCGEYKIGLTMLARLWGQIGFGRLGANFA
jgi:hypothetical protein